MALIAGNAEILGVGEGLPGSALLSKVLIKDRAEQHSFVVPAPIFDSNRSPVRISAIKAHKLSLVTKESGSDGNDLLRQIFQFWG